ncbi:MAG: hypothetical protein ACD_11C00004G0002 [uncultured bacterium]|nr:MAG: hypothetical protein ACD_11C00004G0002 [uncultured bacterium]HBR72116.1 hypothetical protein [Candidatus Moranbacteria bacterium]
MKKILVVSCFMLFMNFSWSCEASTVSDDFNDGNDDGWSALPAGTNYSLGNWKIENNTVKQDLGGDSYKFLLDNFFISNQSVESKVLYFGSSGYGGITIWYQDPNNWVDIMVLPAYGPTGIWIIEKNNGVEQVFKYSYVYNERIWYKLGVDADSLTGEIKVYMDNVYLFTHNAATNNRAGLSGFNSGNSGGYFDDFKLSWNILLTPSGKDECKEEGWKLFNNPTFKNQGNCVSYIESKRSK